MERMPEDITRFQHERENFHKLLADNPNYFGTVPDAEFEVVQAIKSDTSFEQLTCVGLWPEERLLEATIQVKLPVGFLGGLCTKGSSEYVRFYIDWDADGDFSEANEDVGLASVNVHDIPQVRKHHLCYAVARSFQPHLASCKEPYIVRLLAILSWEVPPPPGDPAFVPIWGNALECWIQIDPVHGKVVGVVEGPASSEESQEEQRHPVDRERGEFLELLKKNPNYFDTLPESSIKAVNAIKSDTSYEELKCIGLFPEHNFMEAVLQVKRPYGFLGDLCSQGSEEHVRFFIDWNHDGNFTDANEDLGIASVRVHDIPQAREFHLCYALGRRFEALRSTCQHPYIVKVRAILSWQQVPTGPNFIPVWGNVVECWVQIKPTVPVRDHLHGEIDTPVANACTGITFVAACAPLQGIEITGSADGAPFDHYTLRYSYGGPIVDDAVVYPGCGRPPTHASSTVPVSGGTLGWLDATLLPPGITDFVVYLDVFGSEPTISLSRAFKLTETDVVITEAATVKAFVAADPFHPGSSTKLIKQVKNPAITVPELSIGGAFSVSGSAYTVGCDRIMTQYVLTRFEAPPAAPVPDIPNATGGTPLIAPVVYDDNPSHPWKSGCPISANTIENGDLVSFWSTVTCEFFGIEYDLPKVVSVPFWDSTALNGRYVILLEVRDRLLPAGPFPGDFAAKDQVVVWIDNQEPIAQIHSIGGSIACDDLHLKDFVGKPPAVIRGVAWDAPIDPTAPQQAPNDNFGSYGMGFQKDGDPLAVGVIPGATPTTRVPNTWPTLGPGDGVLANWDIVGALDGGAGPLPPHSPKLARGERCAYVITLTVADTTHVGDSGFNHSAGPVLYAINIINDII